MKNNKVRAKKGMTLIEVIISVALLSILIVPLSTMVMTSLKNKEEASDKQKASYIGQKILEELKAYDNIQLKTNSTTGIKFFNLLDGQDTDEEIKEIGGGSKRFSGNFQRNILGNKNENTSEKLFGVEVNITENEYFKNDFNYIDKSLARYELTFSNNYIYLNTNDFNDFIDVKNVSLIEVNNNNLNVKYSDNAIEKEIKLDKKENKDNILIININDSYNQEINLEIKYNISEVLEIILIKESSMNNSLNIISTGGDILIKEINLDDNLELKDTYNYEVIVRDKNDKELFRGKSSSKFIIK